MHMGFATEHYITAQLQSDGSYLVVEDLYDEADNRFPVNVSAGIG